MNITHYTWNDAKMPPAAIFSQPGSQITRKNRNITIDFSGFLQKNWISEQDVHAPRTADQHSEKWIKSHFL